MHGSLAKIISQMGSNAIRGKPISESMAENPGYFAPLDIAIMEAAEYSGNLSEAFKLLSEWYALTRNLKKKILSGLALPFFILHIAALVAPGPALILGKTSSFGYLASMLAILSVLYVPTFVILGIMYLTPRTGRLRRILDAVVLKIPGLGQGIYYASLSRYCNAFYMLCKAGVPVIVCAEKAATVTGNATVSKLVAGGAKAHGGVNLSARVSAGSCLMCFSRCGAPARKRRHSTWWRKGWRGLRRNRPRHGLPNLRNGCRGWCMCLSV